MDRISAESGIAWNFQDCTKSIKAKALNWTKKTLNFGEHYSISIILRGWELNLLQISENFLQRICYIDGRSLISFLVHFLNSKLYFAIKHSTTSPVANTEKVLLHLVYTNLSLYNIVILLLHLFRHTMKAVLSTLSIVLMAVHRLFQGCRSVWMFSGMFYSRVLL